MLQERVNPNYAKGVREDASLGTPLFDEALNRQAPPETITPSQTRREAHQRIKNNEYPLELFQLRVYNCIKQFGPIGSREISERTKIERYVVTARIVELRDDLGVIEELIDQETGELKKKLDTKTNRNVTQYQVVNGKNFARRTN